MQKLTIHIATGLAILCLTACLKKDAMNIDPDETSASVVELQFIENGNGTTINSGMQYFSGGALILSPLDDADTLHYNVNVAGPSTPNKDITVTIGVNKDAVLDNFKGDEIKYELMPDSIYDFIGTSATIKSGSRVAPLAIKLYPSKIDFTKSYMLPVVITDAQGLTISSNFGIIYFHIIGNPIAGSYSWDFIRYDNQDGTGTPSGVSFADESTVFIPVSPTAIKVPTGYYKTPNYVITFTNTNGVLSDFKVVIDPDELATLFTADGITIVSNPAITVSPDWKTFTCKYVAYNGTAYRNVTDIYRKQ